MYGCISQIFITSNFYALQIKKGFLNYPENCIYKGEIKNKLPHGNGTLTCKTFKLISTFKNGTPVNKVKYYPNEHKDMYKLGYLKNFKLNGSVYYYTLNNQKAVHCEYKDGKLVNNSFVKFWDPRTNLMTYKGLLKDRKRNGYGESFNSGKQSYIGEWKNDKKHGLGIDHNIFSGGVVYGDFKKGDPSGFIKLTYDDELSYIGEYDSGRNGFGVSMHQGAASFGLWKDNKLDKNFPITKISKDKESHLIKYNEKENLSIGIIKNKDEIYNGELLNDTPHGHGVLKNYKTRKKIVGLFDNGELIESLLELQF